MKTNRSTWMISLSIIILLTSTVYGETISYQEQEKSQYDLLIIGPSTFQQTLQPLVDHKNTVGISTMFSSVESIIQSSETNSGRDDAEKIKYFISGIETPLSRIDFKWRTGICQRRRSRTVRLNLRFVDVIGDITFYDQKRHRVTVIFQPEADRSTGRIEISRVVKYEVR